MQYLRSLIFSLVSITTLLPVALAGILTFWLPFPQRFAIISLWGRFNVWAVKLICGLNYEVSGFENIPDKPCIIFSKHQSTWETLVLQKWFRPQVWVLKRELLWVPFFGWGLAMLNPIAIDRKSGKRAIRQIVDQGQKRLDNGYWVVIFPEGTRTAPGSKPDYKIGGSILAAKTGYDVLPIAHNAGEYWGRRQFLKKPGTIKVVIGKPIPTAGKKADQINRETAEWIEARVAEITTLK